MLNLEAEAFWFDFADIEGVGEPKFKILLKLVRACPTFPTSADVERVFSEMGQIKTKNLNFLGF